MALDQVGKAAALLSYHSCLALNTFGTKNELSMFMKS